MLVDYPKKKLFNDVTGLQTCDVLHLQVSPDHTWMCRIWLDT